MIKISDLPAGMIVWKGYQILGITKATLPEKYYDNYCTKVPGNELDYEKASKILLEEFRNGKLGKISLEVPEEIKEA